MAKFKIEHFKNQTATLRDLDTDECMHSSVGAWNEAQTLYIEQSQLVKRLICLLSLPVLGPLSSSQKDESQSPCVLYDVGLGVGANAIAALQVLKTLSHDECKRPLHLVSFEKYPEGMAYALDHVEEFSYLKGFESLIQTLLIQGEVRCVFENGGELVWKLKAGDFRSHLSDVPVPELIYFDLYSPKKCAELWSVEVFQAFYQKTLDRRRKGLSTLLVTYSASTAVRAALVLAGFYVGYGVSTSDKKDTTLASTEQSELKNPLGLAWLEKWKRSGKPYPFGFSATERETLLEQLSKLLEKK